MPRFQVRAPLDVTVLRSGIPDTVPGRSVNVCERGIAAMLAGELVPGEAVGIEVRLPLVADPLRTRAMVRYQDKLRCGLEFVGLPAEQRAAIREWAKEAKAEARLLEVRCAAAVSSPGSRRGLSSMSAVEPASVKKETAGGGDRHGSGGVPPHAKEESGAGIAIVCFSRWRQLPAARFLVAMESGMGRVGVGTRDPEVASAEKPQAQVPAEVMEKLLVHRVEPVYPAEARKANLQGMIALDIVVGREGSVVSMHALNGPDALARAAMDALRWWKFEPYRVNGEPAIVETTVAVEFKK